MKKSPQYNFHIKLVILVIVSPYVVLFGEIPESKHSSANLLDIRFKNLEKEKEALLQIMRPFASISFEYTAVWSRDQKMWDNDMIKNEFHWERSNGNYRHNQVMQLQNKSESAMLQVSEDTCWNKKEVGFTYNFPGSIETFQLPELGKLPLKENIIISIGKQKRHPFLPCFYFPNLKCMLNGTDMLLIDILNDPKHVIKIRKTKTEEGLLLKITIAGDNAFPDREDYIIEFDLERGILLRTILNGYHENNRDVKMSFVIELNEFIELKGWKIPMHSTHSRRDEKGKILESKRFIINKETLKLNEPIPSKVFMPRIAQPVTIYDRALGITFKSSVIPDSTTDAIAAELDGLLEHELKSSKIKQQLK